MSEASQRDSFDALWPLVAGRRVDKIRYRHSMGEHVVEIDVFDLQGRRIRTLVEGAQPAGRHAASWDGRDSGGRRAAAGVYFIRMKSDTLRETKKITLLR